MQLVIENPDNLNLDSFVDYIIDLCKQDISKRIDRSKLEPRDLYLQDYAPGYRWIQIINLGIENLYWRKLGQYYLISVNPEIPVYRTQIKLYTLVKLLEYGRRGFPSYPLFNPVFESISTQIPGLYRMFQMLGNTANLTEEGD